MPHWWWVMISVGLVLGSILIVIWLSPEPCRMKDKTIEVEEFIKHATC